MYPVQRVISASIRIVPVWLIGFFAWTLAADTDANRLYAQSLEDQLSAKVEAFEKVYNSDNIDDLMAMFASDASLSPGGDQTFSEPAQVRGILLDSMMSTDDLSLSVRETTPGDGTAEQSGRYFVDDGSEYGLSGGFSLSWVQTESGEWLVSRLAWTQ